MIAYVLKPYNILKKCMQLLENIEKILRSNSETCKIQIIFNILYIFTEKVLVALKENLKNMFDFLVPTLAHSKVQLRNRLYRFLVS